MINYEMYENSSSSWQAAHYTGEISNNHALVEEEVELLESTIATEGSQKPMLSTTATLFVICGKILSHSV